MNKIIMKDNCLLRDYKYDKYNNLILNKEAIVPCLFNYTFSQGHSDYVDIESSDASAYLDVDDLFVNENLFRLEGMYFIFNRYGQELWYKIVKLTIGRTLLSDNEDNNIFVNLNKATPI